MEIPIMENRNVIMFGLQPWDIEIGSNFKNMAKEISRNNKVLYVNRPLDRISYYKKRKDKKVQTRLQSIRENKNRLEEVEKNIWVLNPGIILESINLLPQGFVYNYLNKKNNKKIASEILSSAEKLGFEKMVMIIDNDFFNALYLKELVRPDVFIYYVRDYLLSQKYFKKHGEKAEPLIMKKADAVVANSSYLNDYANKYNTSTDIGQGCEVEDFIKPDHDMPGDIIHLQGPRIGYCGMLTAARLDIALLEFIAKKRPSWNIILTGPEDDRFASSSLHAIKNIYFLGAKKPSQLPAYVHGFDVCINPQVLNQMTIGNYPRKIDEYLAAGKPVVATDTRAMSFFADYVYLCDTPESYINNIERALSEKVDSYLKEKRVAFARSHTWPASVNKLYEVINNLKK
ncbi:MAG: glycosyltransferase [Bacteroidota bacterium]|nr:glycosyltransferase [Bacteroidota bacterium]